MFTINLALSLLCRGSGIVTGLLLTEKYMPHLLLTAFHYPPEISGGVPRALLFEDFFIRRGWRVTVLTPQERDSGVKGGDILRVPLPGYLAPKKSGGATGGAGAGKSRLKSFAKKYVALPDVFAPWALAAARMALEFARNNPVDLVLTSSPPESAHWIGWRLARACGCKWLVDYRDGWTFEPHREEAKIFGRRVVERWLEKKVLRRCDWITAATRPIAEDLREKIADAGKVKFLATGYDSGVPSARGADNNYFRLMYTGRFSLSHKVRTPAVFVEGMKAALTAEADFARDFRLVLVGDYSAEEKNLWSGAPLSGCVEFMGQRPYAEALSLSAGADMLLLVTPPGLKSIATRKIFDYLKARRPVLALAEGNEAERIVAETGCGVCVSPVDSGAVAAELLRCYRLWKDRKLNAEYACEHNGLYEAEPLFQKIIGPIADSFTPAITGR
jgi:hypothetical protein